MAVVRYHVSLAYVKQQSFVTKARLQGFLAPWV